MIKQLSNSKMFMIVGILIVVLI